jgi:fructokinase
MDTGGLQTDPVLPTGRVQVSFTAGEPAYDIVHPCAYDAIAAPSPAPSCPLLYHGSLALRDQRSRGALHGILAGDPGLVFVDVNLRPPWWDPASLEAMLSHADWVKLNADELTRLGAADGTGAGFVQRHGLRGLILTHGARGAELLTRDGGRFQVRPGTAAEVVDTVGAGDAFAAVTILGLARGWAYELTLQRAQAFASAIVGIRGATPADRAFYQPFVQAWQLAR